MKKVVLQNIRGFLKVLYIGFQFTHPRFNELILFVYSYYKLIYEFQFLLSGIIIDNSIKNINALIDFKLKFFICKTSDAVEMLYLNEIFAFIGAADQVRTGPKSLEGSCATATPQPLIQ